MNVNDKVTRPISIGHQGENLAREIQFDVTAWAETYGEGTVALLLKRPGDVIPYPAIVTREGNVVTWEPTETDTKKDGYGEIELQYFVNEKLVKSDVFPITIPKSIVGDDAPEPYAALLIQITEAAQQAVDASDTAEEAAERAEEAADLADKVANMNATAETLAAGTQATVQKTIVDDTLVLHFGIPAGPAGPQGDPGPAGKDGIDGSDGQDGHSPVVTATKSGGTTTIYVDGTAIATIEDGTDGHSPAITASKTGRTTTIYVDGTAIASVQDGNDGQDGSDGQDGFSPAVSITDITGGHAVTITDKNGAHTFNIMDGVDGQDGSDGQDGTDGFSPTITITDITGGHTVTVTNASGSTAFNVMDGVDGDDYVLTAQDKQDIADLVIADLPTWTGGTY